MKGTHCGNRALALAVLLISFAAVAPAVANADVPGSNPAPAAPAVPALPAPALPSLVTAPVQATTPVASATVAPVAPSVAVTAPATKVAVTPTSGSLHVATPGAKVVKAVGVAESAGIKVANASAAKATKRTQGAQQLGVKVTRIASGMVIKLVPPTVKKQSVVVKKKAGRLLANGGDDWGDDDWGSGCTKGTYTGCSQTPVGPIDNRCYQTDTPLGTSSGTQTATGGDPPPFSPTEQVMFTQGTQTTWTRTKNVYKNIAGIPTLVGVIVEMKSFIRGLYGTAPSGTIYKSGKDTSTQWSVFLPLDASFFLDKREFTELLVQKNSGPAPSMWYSEHDVVKPGSITVKWRIVCSNGAKADDDRDEGHDHDRSGDQDKYKHHREDYHGYNDDDPGSWDQNDS